VRRFEERSALLAEHRPADQKFLRARDA